MEAILSGETEVAVAQLHTYVDKLMTPGPDGGTGMDKQFKVSLTLNMFHWDRQSQAVFILVSMKLLSYLLSDIF